MKHNSLILGACAFTLAMAAISCNAVANTISIFPTGVDALGNQLAGGAVDPHYGVVETGSPAIILSRNRSKGAWPFPTSGKWINYADISGTSGPHSFVTTFDLTGLDETTATLSGLWSCDFDGHIELNGHDTGIGLSGSANDFTSLHPFTISTGFQAGVNTLKFVISKMDAWDGVIVSQISGTAVAVPEPIGLASVGVALVGLVACVWRKRR